MERKESSELSDVMDYRQAFSNLDLEENSSEDESVDPII